MQTHKAERVVAFSFEAGEQKNEFYGCQRRSDSCINVVPFEGVSISYWMDSSCLRSITMFTGYFSTVTKKICWFTLKLKLNRSLRDRSKIRGGGRGGLVHFYFGLPVLGRPYPFQVQKKCWPPKIVCIIYHGPPPPHPSSSSRTKATCIVA